ncbi:hypothetical protein JQN58_04910 [Aneurinibacillus sp. BA2021]|nr:hypothetical protein [Aneurinibacillus sp. BA2021]
MSQEKSDEKKMTTGCNFILSRSLFMEMLREKLGINTENIMFCNVVTMQSGTESISVCLLGDDPDMPALTEDGTPRLVIPVIEKTRVKEWRVL